MRRALVVALPLSCAALGSAWLIALEQAGASQLPNVDFGTLLASVRSMPQPSGSFAAPDLNTPVLRLLLLPLAGVSPSAAFHLWSAAGLLSSLASLAIVLSELRREGAGPAAHAWLLAAFALFPGTALGVWLGQVALVVMLPMTLAWRQARRGAWMGAGAWLGLVVALKPVWLLFLPWLAWRRRWPACAAALAALAASAGMAALVFGPGEYANWLTALGEVRWTAMRGNASLAALSARAFSSSPFIVYRPLAEAAWLVAPIAIVSGVAVLLATARVAARAQNPDRDFALVAVTCLLVSPLGWAYYLVAATGPLTILLAVRGVTPLAALSLFFLYWPWVWYDAPGPLLSLTLGSAYAWGLLALWVWTIEGGAPSSDAHA